jgi:membrane protease YdiL (CAAX protease family)
MNDLGGQQASPWMDAMSLLILVATLVPWVWMVRRLVARRPILPYQPRRPVPWGGLDVALVVMFLWGAVGLVYLCERAVLEHWADARFAQRFWIGATFADATPWMISAGVPAICAPAVTAVAPANAVGHLAPWLFEGWINLQHPLVVVMSTDPSPLTLTICLLSAVVVAPIAEEFLFRLLLQGWLEAVERRLRRQIPFLRHTMRGLMPVAISASVFALMHWREAAPPNPAHYFLGLIAGGAAYLLMVGFAIALVKVRVGAGAVDLGLVPAKIGRDVVIGLVAALAILAPIYLLQVLVQTYLTPAKVAGDPVTLVFFAAVLGTLYARTHRIVPAITLHMALNLSSLAMAWFSVGT